MTAEDIVQKIKTSNELKKKLHEELNELNKMWEHAANTASEDVLEKIKKTNDQPPSEEEIDGWLEEIDEFMTEITFWEIESPDDPANFEDKYEDTDLFRIAYNMLTIQDVE